MGHLPTPLAAMRTATQFEYSQQQEDDQVHIQVGSCYQIVDSTTASKRASTGDGENDTHSRHHRRSVFSFASRSSRISSASSATLSSSRLSRTKRFSCQFDPSTKKDRSLVLTFDANGNACFHEMSRHDILELTQSACTPNGSSTSTSTTTTALLAPEEDPEGIAQEDNPRRNRTGSKHNDFTVCDVQRVHIRDLRKLDNVFTVSNEPSIVVRKQAILLNADPIRAVVMRDQCLVFVPDGADSLLSMLKAHFKEGISSGDRSVAYEFHALEALLASLCNYFEDEFDKTEPLVNVALEKLACGPIASKELETIRVFKNSLNEFESQVDGIRRCLMDILDNEEDLRLLYLTKLHHDPSLLQDLWRMDSEEAQVLLENYMHDIYSTHTKANLMLQRIHNTESVVMMKLDAARNYLLGVDLVFSLIAIGVSIGTFVTGAFGMNIDFDMPYKNQAFWYVWLFTILVGTAIVAWGVLFFRRKGILMW